MRLLRISALLLLAACASQADSESAAPAGDSTRNAAQTAAPPPAPAPAAVRTGPIDSTDFVVAGVEAGMDSAAVLRALGPPDSVRVDENPYDGGGRLPTWFYDGLTVLFTEEGVHGVNVEGPRHATARGVRVGDPAERVRAVYGEPTSEDSQSWDYADPADGSGLHMIGFQFAGGRVTSIFLGWVLD